MNINQVSRPYEDYFVNQTATFKGLSYDFKTKQFSVLNMNDQDSNKNMTIGDFYNISEVPINTLLNEMICNEKECEEFKSVLAQNLLGAKNKKSIVEINGGPNSGKTFLKNVIKNTFSSINNFVVNASAECFYKSDNKDISLHYVEQLYECRSATIIMVDDFDADKLISSGYLKMITSNDACFSQIHGNFHFSLPTIMFFGSNINFDLSNAGFKRRHMQINLSGNKTKVYSNKDIDMLAQSMMKMLLGKCNEIVDNNLLNNKNV
jgi:hypothetical protein